MKTFRGGAGWDQSTWPADPGTADETTWVYDEASGLLTQKQYADGSSVTYTYTVEGKLETRNWSRGLTTTYSYSPQTEELLWGIGVTSRQSTIKP
ncbi:hypothetical protein ACFLQR_02730 [Verrucomicrobiota bacterium]